MAVLRSWDTPRKSRACCVSGHRQPISGDPSKPSGGQVRNTVFRDLSMKSLKTISQIRSFLARSVHRLYAMALSFPKKTEDWFDKKGYTRRRIKHDARRLGTLIVLGFILVILALAWYPLLETLHSILRAITRTLTDFGEWLNLSNPGDFVVTLVAEILAFVFATIVAGLFARSREPKLLAPKIRFWPQRPRTNKDGTKSCTLCVSNEEGETAALECEARITINEITKRDILDLAYAKFNSCNFTPTIEADLLWDDGERLRTLRSGEDTEIEVLRLIPVRDGVEAHFEIPSCDDAWTSVVCLRLSRFYPKVRVVPFNSHHTTHSYKFQPSSKWKDWALELDK